MTRRFGLEDGFLWLSLSSVFTDNLPRLRVSECLQLEMLSSCRGSLALGGGEAGCVCGVGEEIKVAVEDITEGAMGPGQLELDDAEHLVCEAGAVVAGGGGHHVPGGGVIKHRVPHGLPRGEGGHRQGVVGVPGVGAHWPAVLGGPRPPVSPPVLPTRSGGGGQGDRGAHRAQAWRQGRAD